MSPTTTDESEAKIPKSDTLFNVNRNVKCGIFPSVYRREQSEIFYMDSLVPPVLGEEDDEGDTFADLPWESFVNSTLEANKDNQEVNQDQLKTELDKVEAQLRHGDVVNFSDYRLVQGYVVYRLEPTDKPLLLKTYMEYGYGAPCDFSDAPKGFFLEAYDTWYYYHLPDCLWPGSDSYDDVMNQIEERKKNPKYHSVSELDYGDRTVDLSRFPSDYVLIFEDGSDELLPSWHTLEEVACDGLTSEAVARIKQRYQHRRQMQHNITSTITHGLFKNKLPQDVITHMTQFIA